MIFSEHLGSHTVKILGFPALALI